MKKTAIFAAVLSTLSVASFAANAASTGTIYFNGELTANTCDVIVDNQSENATIKLPTIGTNQLNAPGATAGRTSFNMALSNCTGTLQTASAYFQAGSTVDAATGRLKNTGGTAGRVSLQMRDGANSNVIQVGNGNQVNNTTYVDISSTSATLPYEVEYYAEGATTPGTVVSNVVYSIQYK
ncbi:fimbrial protein [Enterobacillus tribolii]|uniref:Major type 1 subunit fimbrin (Pilin) n=1 Tax=Enterobacillus tribolii TaxID=1487935 RepID=A0A370R424_9GAMM|nr:fimbrial protein [Enterobacillus tribolii]MBW7984431.1 type 1 fimbrial protein [Enterobacillus tribolii]RDK97169.1 major type 1 subunit fimbrin (pilin) [Enterobacillus tribolii]